jgi:dolichol-phosphate mannosyltransferase
MNANYPGANPAPSKSMDEHPRPQDADLVIVVPTLNEVGNVALLIPALEACIQGIEWEILFVDDNSSDGTAAYLNVVMRDNHRVRLLERTGKRGLASACLDGIRASRAPYVAVMDADMQHDERLLSRMLSKLRTESLDVVIGSRTITGGGMGPLSSWRTIVSRAGSVVAGKVCGCSVSDAMSGYFMMRRSYFDRCSEHIDGVGFKVLLELLTASDVPVKVAEIPYVFRARRYGASKFGLRVGVEYLRFLTSQAFRNRSIRPKGKA